MARYASLTVRGVCFACGQPLPLAGLTLRHTCPYCFTENPIAVALWRKVLGKLDRGHEELAVGQERALTAAVDGAQVSFTIGRVEGPRCEKCEALFDVDALGVGYSRNFACTRCGDPASTEAPPAWARSIMPGACQLYFTDPKVELGGALALEPDKEIRPVVLACPKCTGSLEATVQSERIMSCRYCQADVYLPDAVWGRLHPVKKVRPFFVRFEGQTRAEQSAQLSRAAREQADRERRRADSEREAARAARAAKIASARSLAWLAALAFFFVVAGGGSLLAVAAGLAPVLGLDAMAVELSASLETLGVGLVVAGGVYLLITVGIVTRPIQLATERPFEWMLFCTWFWVPFSVLFPFLGAIFALVRALVLARGKFMASTIRSGGRYGSATHYPAISLEHGEGRPAALVFFSIALGWGFVALLSSSTELFG